MLLRHAAALLVLVGSVSIPALVADRGSAAASTESIELLHQIDRYRGETWRWQRVMGLARTRTAFSARRVTSLVYRRWVRDLWRGRAARARRRAASPPHEPAWRCIQRHEARWNDPNPPYYGGLQMDWHFMRLYGGWLLRKKGSADRWSPTEQMWAGERAVRSGRWFYPWPNSARLCGLI